MNGFLCVLKPPGMTSSDVVVRVRRKLGRGVKVGHAGTLDPEASGVLPLMIGRAARLFDYLVEKEDIRCAAQTRLCDRYAGRAWGDYRGRGRACDTGAAGSGFAAVYR